MNIPVQRYLDTRMSEKLAERFHINAALDALRCKGVPQGVKVAVGHAVPFEERLETQCVGAWLGRSWRTGQKVVCVILICFQFCNRSKQKGRYRHITQ